MLTPGMLAANLSRVDDLCFCSAHADARLFALVRDCGVSGVNALTPQHSWIEFAAMENKVKNIV